MQHTSTGLGTLGILAALLLGGCGHDSTPTRRPRVSPSAPTVPTPVAADPLTVFRTRMQRLISTCVADDAPAAEADARDLVLPDAKAWFAARFGADHEQLAAIVAEYEALTRDVAELPGVVRAKWTAGQTALLTERFVTRRDPESTAYQSLALEQMRTPAALYSMRMVEAGETQGWHLWSFALVDGTFRFVGPMLTLAPEPMYEQMGALRIRDARALQPDWLAGD